MLCRRASPILPLLSVFSWPANFNPRIKSLAFVLSASYTSPPVTLWQAIFVTLVTFVAACSAHVLPVRLLKPIALWSPRPAFISTAGRVPNLSLCYESAQHTLGHVNCDACENSRRLVMDKDQLSELPFREAASAWLDFKRLVIQSRTVRDNRQYIKTLAAFLGDMVLKDLHVGNVREYQKWRLDHGIGAQRINHETSCLGQIMKEAGLWHKIQPYYRPLPVKKETPGVALTEEQLRNLFQVARRDTRWEVALHASILSANTTCGPGEIKNLRLQDVDIPNGIIRICKGKNRYRERSVPMNDDALRSARYLYERARDKGATDPEHYLLPHRAQKRGQGYDPTRPQGHWNKAWDRMRKAAGMPHLRQYDLRHTAITRLLENPTVSERVVIEIAGHVSNKMLERYSHQRIAAKRAAVDALSGLGKSLRGLKLVT